MKAGIFTTYLAGYVFSVPIFAGLCAHSASKYVYMNHKDDRMRIVNQLQSPLGITIYSFAWPISIPYMIWNYKEFHKAK